MVRKKTLPQYPFSPSRRKYRALRVRLHPHRERLSEREIAMSRRARAVFTERGHEGGGDQDTQALREQLALARADFDNMRKRMLKQAEEAKKFAAQDVVESLIPALDCMEHAILAARQKPDAQTLLEGIEAIHGQFRAALQGHGVEVVHPEGEAFDPNLHEALGTEPRDDMEPNTVIDIFQDGIVLNGRLVRPARVRVSSKP